MMVSARMRHAKKYKHSRETKPLIRKIPMQKGQMSLYLCIKYERNSEQRTEEAAVS